MALGVIQPKDRSSNCPHRRGHFTIAAPSLCVDAFNRLSLLRYPSQTPRETHLSSWPKSCARDDRSESSVFAGQPVISHAARCLPHDACFHAKKNANDIICAGSASYLSRKQKQHILCRFFVFLRVSSRRCRSWVIFPFCPQPCDPMEYIVSPPRGITIVMTWAASHAMSFFTFLFAISNSQPFILHLFFNFSIHFTPATDIQPPIIPSTPRRGGLRHLPRGRHPVCRPLRRSLRRHCPSRRDHPGH